MLTKVRSRLTYPHIASTLALFLALTGGAFALEGRNSVDSRDLKPEAVRSSDITNNGVRSVDIRNRNGVKGVDVKEATLDQVPSALSADNATNAENASNADTVDGKNADDFLGVGAKAADSDLLDGQDSAEFLGVGAKAADSDLLDGQDSAAFLGRGSGSATGAVGLNWYSYFANTGASADYVFGQMKLRTTGTAGQFQICGNSTAVGSFNWVRYVNGVRSAGTVGTSACTAAFDPGAGGDFQVQMRRSIVFGVHSGDSTTNENYNLYGFGQL